jgi:hypothetical protein
MQDPLSSPLYYTRNYSGLSAATSSGTGTCVTLLVLALLVNGGGARTSGASSPVEVVAAGAAGAGDPDANLASSAFNAIALNHGQIMNVRQTTLK